MNLPAVRGGVSVECYSGYTYAQEPRAVIWRGARLPVTVVEQRWRTPGGPAFTVQVEHGDRFELHYDEVADLWSAEALCESANLIEGSVKDKEVQA